MSFHIVIPARFASTRLPGKPLELIGGVPMVQCVVRQACQTQADEIVVATDDGRIAAVVSDPRSPDAVIAQITDSGIESGTDRVAAVASYRNWPDDTLVVNVQGDEPFVPPSLIDQLAKVLMSRNDVGVATLATPIQSVEEFMDPNVVKVVTDKGGLALYFSRAPIPWHRDVVRNGKDHKNHRSALRHVGMYAYRVGTLKQISGLAASSLEKTERLEQLRLLQNGIKVMVEVCQESPGLSIDTPEDLEQARRLVR
jgi:3-deoxy-manno-octulosonate cytidylyltransferase (CMP-KDO synthetase)